MAVNSAFNDIDRRLYPPVETLHERHDELIREYETVGRDFAAEADACGLSDCLRCLVLSRVFTAIYDEWPTEKTRLLFEEIERLGYLGIDLLISLRTIWADVLAEAGEDDEARSVARLLKQDMEEYARLHAGQASNEQFIDTLTWLHEQFHV